MTYEFDPFALGWVILGIVIGLVLARLTRGSARRPARIADSVANAAATAAARTDADAARRELAAAQAAVRPLSDEIDRLKRDLAKAKRPVQEPLPGMVPLTPMTPLAPMPPLGTVDAPEAMAGTGPIVIGDAAAAVDIRRLKGVGDKFAAALDGLGLGTIDALARLNADEAIDADTRLGTFNGRIARDRLVEQATLIDEGRMTEYATRFGTL